MTDAPELDETEGAAPKTASFHGYCVSDMAIDNAAATIAPNATFGKSQTRWRPSGMPRYLVRTIVAWTVAGGIQPFDVRRMTALAPVSIANRK